MALAFLFSTVCAIIGFVLSILGLLAGNTPGFMEDFSIIMVSRHIISCLHSKLASTFGHADVLSPSSTHLPSAGIMYQR